MGGEGNTKVKPKHYYTVQKHWRDCSRWSHHLCLSTPIPNNLLIECREEQTPRRVPQEEQWLKNRVTNQRDRNLQRREYITSGEAKQWKMLERDPCLIYSLSIYSNAAGFRGSPSHLCHVGNGWEVRDPAIQMYKLPCSNGLQRKRPIKQCFYNSALI